MADDGRADDGAAPARVDDGASPGREPPTREPPAREDAGESPVEREPEASERDAKMIEELRRALSASLPKMPTPMKSASKPSRSGRSDSVREVPKPSPATARAVSFRLAEDGLKSEELNGSGEENSGERRDRAAALRDVEATAKRTRQELRRQARVAVARDVAAEAGEGEAQVLDVVPPPETLQLPPRASSVKKREGATRWTKPANAYETKLEKLLAIAERAGSNAERVRDEITQLGERVDSLNKPVHVQPWQERGNSWAGDMKSSRRDNSERSSSAGTILNPKNAKSREMRTQFENASSQGEAVSPTTPERPKMVTSVLRSDLLKSMGVMSAEEKLARLGLRSVPEDEGMSSETGTSFARASTAPRRAWNDRVSKAKSNHSDSEYGMMKVSPPPPSLRSQTSKSQARDALDESPTMNYVDQLKAQAKLARAESAKSWKPGRGVKSGAAQL
ncbi:hypothetical protein BE221DRAFT_208292 [Ostreococcus tauri]|uniref:Uncharacterized protein n=1 Tax=Ostreococcus tauri TaxID=70448 RepID=A0A1Y5I6B2_OSTTA|nr:hypothetical protein BE221DRAFT_208292 [Ostreococcus tauri]